MDQTTRHVELNEDLWEADLAGMDHNMTHQEPQEQQADMLFGGSSAAERANWMHGPKSKARELSTGIIGDGTSKIGVGLRRKGTADRGGGRHTARPQYTNQIKKNLDATNSAKPTQKNRPSNNKVGYSVPDKGLSKQPAAGAWATQSPALSFASARGDFASMSQNKGLAGKGMKSRPEAPVANTLGADRPLASARASLAPQASNDLLSSTLRTGSKYQRSKKTPNPTSGH